MNGPEFRVYVAAGADGFIATPDGGVGWLDPFQAGEDYGYEAFAAEVGTVVMGRATFDHVLGFGGGWPYPEKRSLVLTSRPLPPDAPPGIGRWEGPGGVAGLASELRGGPAGGDVWIMGGGRTIRAFLDAGAVDRIELFVMPVLLGAGLPLFEPSPRGARRLSPVDCLAYPNGVARLTYSMIASDPRG